MNRNASGLRGRAIVARVRAGGAILPILGLTALASCASHAAGDAGDADNATAQGESAIVSNRPQTNTTFTAVVRLASPPLLESGEVNGGRVRVDPRAKRRLEREQARFLDAVKAMSSDVHVLYTYRLTFNGFALVAPIALRDRFRGLPGVVSLEEEGTFEAPQPEVAPIAPRAAAGPGRFAQGNSVKFIGGEAAHARGITGKGVRVGVIDTGIDYTHAMLGGVGTAEAYAKNDPTTIEPGTFPTAKVIGGIDLVGSDYDASSLDESKRVPKPDADPLDEAGHGSHVSGTIAGHGDGTNTYDGVAPDASLYAIKIFGRSGSVGDTVIMAALERAADPNGDLDPSDRLDAVNLSLGADWGTRYALYEQLVHALARNGTVTVCAAGNAGATPFIVSAPSTAPDAISVAAAVDDSPWNWTFDAVRFTDAGQDRLVQAYEAVFTKPIAEAQGIEGKLVPIGLAASDLTPQQAAAVAGNVALIHRGQATFYDKVKRAQAAGAIGVVVANNVAGDPFVMGGDGPTLAIPAIMITRDYGAQLEAEIAASKEVRIAFHTDQRIEKPEIVDSLADFTSRGPRSVDGLVKPEIAAPGFQVISARMGGGNQATTMSGTSMATPHMTGVVALLRQALPDATPAEIKARVMETAAPTHDVETKLPEPVAMQGAGRVRVLEALDAPITIDPPSLSLGWISAVTPATRVRVLRVRNEGDAWLEATIAADARPGLAVEAPIDTSWIAPHGEAFVPVVARVDLSKSTAFVTELDGAVHVTVRPLGTKDAAPTTVSVPLLLEARRGAQVAVASSETTAAATTLTFANDGAQAGDAIPFSLLGVQRFGAARRVGPCSLASAGARVRAGEGASSPAMLEIGVRLAHPLSTWNLCEVSVLVDADGDGVPDQELAGTSDPSLRDDAPADPYGSFLIDAAKMRAVQAKMEKGTAGAGDTYPSAVLDVQPFTRFPFAQVGVVAADVSKLRAAADGKLHLKVGLLPAVEGAASDDFLGGSLDGEWLVVDPAAPALRALPASASVAVGQTASLALPPLGRRDAVLVFLPQNDPASGSSLLAVGNGAFVLR